MGGTRTERDSLGERQVPAEAYYGIQTLRAIENFPISGLRPKPALCRGDGARQARGGRRQPRAGAARRGQGGGDRAGVRRNPRRRAARVVCRRRLPGGRRHVAQHERQRGDRQPRHRAARRRQRGLRARPPERPRQHGAVDQRRLPDGHPDRRGRAVGAAARLRCAGCRTPSPQRRPSSTPSSSPGAPTCRTPCRSGSARSSAPTATTSGSTAARSSARPTPAGSWGSAGPPPGPGSTRTRPSGP